MNPFIFHKYHRFFNLFAFNMSYIQRPPMKEMASKKWIFVQSHDYKETYLIPEDDFEKNFEIIQAPSDKFVSYVRYREDKLHFEVETYSLGRTPDSVIPIVHVMDPPAEMSVVGVYVIDHPNVRVQTKVFAEYYANLKWYYIQTPSRRRSYLVQQGLFEDYFTLVTPPHGQYQSTVRYKNGINDFERSEERCILSETPDIPIPQLHNTPFSIVGVYYLE